MSRSTLNIFAKFVLIISPVIAYAHKDGPDPRRTGAPGDAPTACADSGCHSLPLNSFGGSVTIILPDGNSYKPGVKQHIMVRVADPAQRRWGFQFTARLAGNPANGQAGDLVPGSDGFTQVLCNDGRATPCRAGAEVQFIEHTVEGTRLGTRDGATFEFDWTPPSNDAGDIVFYAAGNAANGNGDEFGDHIYTTSVRLTNCPSSGPKPAITGVVNGASFEKGIAPNSWITISGTNLSSSTREWGDGDFQGGKLPEGLSCTVVMVNNKAAYVRYVSPTQINAIAPGDNSTGSVQVSVTSVGQTSDGAAVQLQTIEPAFFLFGDGKYLAATHLNNSLLGKNGLFPSAPNLTTPAKAGEVIILYGTGFGPTDPAIPPGQVTDKLAPITTPLTITIGGSPSTVSFKGLVPPFAQLYQFNVQVPATAKAGDADVVAQIGGQSSPKTATCCFITVQ